MARFRSPVAFLVTGALLALAPLTLEAQRPALAGEKARVAEAVKRDLSRLAALQRTHHQRAKLFAADLKDLNFTPTSGAEINIAFASMSAWAANASHATLSPVKCFLIVSANDAVDAPTSQPFCTDAEPGSAAARVASAGATDAAESKAAPAATAEAPATKAAATSPPISQPNAQKSAAAPPRSAPAATKAPATSTPARTEPTRAPATPPATANRPARATAAPSGAAQRSDNAAVRMITRDAGEVSVADRVESVTPSEFSNVLIGMAREAVAVMDAPPPEVVRDPYESTQEYEARRAQALAEYQRREQDYFRATKRSFVVQLPVRAVRYDADGETLEFSVEALRLPQAREGRSQLTVACFTRPVFWCMPDSGMTYDANDLWKVPRATARQFDVLRTPMTLTARFTVGGRPDGERALAISLIDMELQARGQTVQRWNGR